MSLDLPRLRAIMRGRIDEWNKLQDFLSKVRLALLAQGKSVKGLDEIALVRELYDCSLPEAVEVLDKVAKPDLWESS